MNSFNRRDFLKISAALGGSALAFPTLLAACASSESKFNLDALSLARVSSDVYQTDLDQRFAFTIFEERNVAAQGNIDIAVIDPDQNVTDIKDVRLRNQGIKDLGIYSIQHKFNKAGFWRIETEFFTKELSLDFQVFEAPTAPGLGQKIPDSPSPTENDPMDAQILCTAFEGQCELHQNSVPELLAAQKPFVVLFATPARCSTSYCGPVLELTRDVVKDFDLPTIHIEIYKDETSPDTLDIVKKWNLPSEPWLFGIDENGNVVKRLDGAFDQSEITEIYEILSA